MQMESDVVQTSKFRLKLLISELVYKLGKNCTSVIATCCDLSLSEKLALSSSMLTLERTMLNLVDSAVGEASLATVPNTQLFSTFLPCNNVNCPEKKQ
ncbi:hypothetical protein s21009500007_000861 [Ehrlichia canis]|uniref:hypothetical protein n=2 Tax=Ehrlichia canis TaxID=944 RepID=UPI000C85DE67|nr:hypothetical protein [Ehrlichia canis]AUO54512.1 hypothetical protein C1I72_01155 [Ehrlichia canis]UKC53817.1 hypothetical protein s20019040002_000862 [Ehrlichia canis]UKC54753.1 hypothetical protein s20026770001_000861 [Ehrlichia canis]UKC55689.1 hypothetical protein s21009500007_000861 [Ehrlichia canis]